MGCDGTSIPEGTERDMENQMKIRISIPGASIIREYDEETAMETFRQLAGRLLNISMQEKLMKVEVGERVDAPVWMLPHTNAKGYKGFLYLQCPSCGAERGFSPKTPITETICRECNITYPVEELVSLYVNCECGSTFRYKTNKKEDMFDITCLNCGQPVAVSWNAKQEIYETIRRNV